MLSSAIDLTLSIVSMLLIEASIRRLSRHANLLYPKHLLFRNNLAAGVGVHLCRLLAIVFPSLASSTINPSRAYLALATGESNVDETTGVFEALESTALGDLGLLLGLNLFVKLSLAFIGFVDRGSREGQFYRTLGV